jgi:hypothetical protein
MEIWMLLRAWKSGMATSIVEIWGFEIGEKGGSCYVPDTDG